MSLKDRSIFISNFGVLGEMGNGPNPISISFC